MGNLDRLAQSEGPLIGLLLAGDHPEERRLTSAIRSNDPDNAAGGEREVHILHQHAVAIGLHHAFSFDDGTP